MKEYLIFLIIIPITLLIIKQVRKRKQDKSNGVEFPELNDFYNLPENSTEKQKRRLLLLALAKNYDSEYRTVVKLKRYEQLFFDQIIPKELVDQARLERETVLLGKYIIESESDFCDFTKLDEEARGLAKLYINNDNDIPLKKNLIYLPLDPEKFEMINEMYSKIKHVGDIN